MVHFKKVLLVTIGSIGLLLPSQADASLTLFQSFVGNDSLSTGGCGSITQTCTFTSIVPTGSTVVGAYLYSSLYSQTTSSPIPTGTLNGTPVTFSAPLGLNNAALLQAYRADVTSLVAPVVAGASSSTLSFTVTENSASQDGEGLVIVYSNPSLPTQSVGILDGFSASAGDMSRINFSSPLTPSSPGFITDFRIGDGFSYDSVGCTANNQVSIVKVNGQTLTNVAGCNDDSTDEFPGNGNLFTIGSDTDPYTANVAGGQTVTALDHERYNLTPYIADGDTSINVSTLNPSGDDNIFLETFLVSGIAGFNAPPPSPTPTPTTDVPEPASLLLLGAGLIGLRALRQKL